MPACDECGGRLTSDPRTGIMVCESCGLESTEPVFDQSVEYDEEQGKPHREVDRGSIKPQIIFKGKGDKETEHKLAETATRYNLSHRERRAMQVENEIEGQCARLSLPSIMKDEAIAAFRRHGNEQMPGMKQPIAATNMRWLVPALISIACQQHGRVIDIKFLVKSHSEARMVRRYIRQLRKVVRTQIPNRTVADYVHSFGNQLHISIEAQRVAIEVVEPLASSANAKNFAGAALFMVTGIRQVAFINLTGISGHTLRKYIRLIKERNPAEALAKLLVPPIDVSKISSEEYPDLRVRGRLDSKTVARIQRDLSLGKSKEDIALEVGTSFQAIERIAKTGNGSAHTQKE